MVVHRRHCPLSKVGAPGRPQPTPPGFLSFGSEPGPGTERCYLSPGVLDLTAACSAGGTDPSRRPASRRPGPDGRTAAQCETRVPACADPQPRANRASSPGRAPVVGELHVSATDAQRPYDQIAAESG